VTACKRHACVLEEPHDSRRSAGYDARPSREQRAEVRFVEAVDVLLRRDRLEHARRIDVLRQRQLHEDAVHRRIGIQFSDACD
jgi:hypothetical protein